MASDLLPRLLALQADLLSLGRDSTWHPHFATVNEAIAESAVASAAREWIACAPGTAGWCDLRYDPRVIAVLGDDRPPECD